MNKKIIGWITTFLMLFNAFFCCSIAGENVNKTEKLDDYDVSVSCSNNSKARSLRESGVGADIKKLQILL